MRISVLTLALLVVGCAADWRSRALLDAEQSPYAFEPLNWMAYRPLRVWLTDPVPGRSDHVRANQAQPQAPYTWDWRLEVQ